MREIEVRLWRNSNAALRWCGGDIKRVAGEKTGRRQCQTLRTLDFLPADSIRSSYCDGSAADSALRYTRWQWGAYRAARLACFRTSNLCKTRNRCNTSAFRVESSRHLHALPQHSVAARVRNDLSGRPTRRQFRWCQVRRIIWRQDMLGRSLIQHRAPGKRRVRGTRSFARLNIRRRGSFSLTGK